MWQYHQKKHGGSVEQCWAALSSVAHSTSQTTAKKTPHDFLREDGANWFWMIKALRDTGTDRNWVRAGRQEEPQQQKVGHCAKFCRVPCDIKRLNNGVEQHGRPHMTLQQIFYRQNAVFLGGSAVSLQMYHRGQRQLASELSVVSCNVTASHKASLIGFDFRFRLD